MFSFGFGVSEGKGVARFSRAAIGLGLAASLSACSVVDQVSQMWQGDKYTTEITPDTPASKTYNEALHKLSNGSASEAGKKFTELGKQYPGSDWARKGLLMTIYANYEAADYTGAETSAERYLKEYPNSEDAAYVTYLQANAYYEQIPDISRDQDSASKALTAFQDLIKKYPKSEYVEDAKFKVQVTADQLAGKEMSIGRYLPQPQQLHSRNQSLPIGAAILSDDPPRRGSAVPLGRGLPWARNCRRSGNRRRSARAQLP